MENIIPKIFGIGFEIGYKNHTTQVFRLQFKQFYSSKTAYNNFKNDENTAEKDILLVISAITNNNHNNCSF